MAYCENCGTKGHDPRTMAVAQNTTSQFILIGPCCQVRHQTPPQQELEYGLEFSSHYGLLAYMQYQGMKLEYRRTPEQMAAWFAKADIPMQMESVSH